jgi:hypothetical protein
MLPCPHRARMDTVGSVLDGVDVVTSVLDIFS